MTLIKYRFARSCEQSSSLALKSLPEFHITGKISILQPRKKAKITKHSFIPLSKYKHSSKLLYAINWISLPRYYTAIFQTLSRKSSIWSRNQRIFSGPPCHNTGQQPETAMQSGFASELMAPFTFLAFAGHLFTQRIQEMRFWASVLKSNGAIACTGHFIAQVNLNNLIAPMPANDVSSSLGTARRTEHNFYNIHKTFSSCINTFLPQKANPYFRILSSGIPLAISDA